MTPDDVRALALALPGTSEAPHHDRTAFRAGGKIFATVLPDGDSVNVLMPEEQARAAVDEAHGEVALLPWGRRIAGVRVPLTTDPALLADLLEDAWRLRAPAGVVAAQEAGRETRDADG